MNVQKYIEAVGDRVQGRQASRLRAATMAGTAGFAVALVVYHVLREPDD